MRHYLLFSLLIIILASCASSSSKITVIGVAENAKYGAVIVNGKRMYYIDQISEWADSVYGQMLEVKGVLAKKKFSKNNDEKDLRATIEGTIYVIKDAKWEVQTNK